MTGSAAWQAVRREYPALERFVYLNAAGGGPLCRKAYEGVCAYYEEHFQLGDTRWDEWLDRVEDTRHSLAELLGTTPREVAFLSNASAGLNLVAELLDGEGVVLALADDFPSVTLPWIHRGRSMRFIESRENGVIRWKDIERGLKDGPAVFCGSLVQYKTGFRLDLTRFLRNIDQPNVPRIATVIDATQAFGVFPIDLGLAPVEALVFSAYKWVGGGYGIAPLVIRNALLERVGTPWVGWRSARDPYALKNREVELTTEARGLEMGHPPFAGVFALRGALEMLRDIGISSIEARVQWLVGQLQEELKKRRLRILSPTKPEERSSITLIQVPEPGGMAAELKKRGIFVSARGQGLRVSLHYYNNMDDISRFLEALDSLLSERA